MRRHLLSWLALAGVLLWLIFSYSPSLRVLLPQLPWASPGWGSWLQGAAVVCLVLFLAVQLFLVRSTIRLRNTWRTNAVESGVQLQIVAELFWTSLPLLMTIGLAILSYATWRSVAP